MLGTWIWGNGPFGKSKPLPGSTLRLDEFRDAMTQVWYVPWKCFQDRVWLWVWCLLLYCAFCLREGLSSASVMALPNVHNFKLLWYRFSVYCFLTQTGQLTVRNGLWIWPRQKAPSECSDWKRHGSQPFINAKKRGLSSGLESFFQGIALVLSAFTETLFFWFHIGISSKIRAEYFLLAPFSLCHLLLH